MKKLNTYLLAGSLLTFGMSNAAIIHTDINDETLGSGGSITIDMNNDATTDFEIYDGSFGGPQEPSIIFNADAGFVMVGTFAGGADWDVMSALTANTVIDANANFANNGVDGYIDPFWTTTSFPTDQDYFLGATFKIGANQHYGWIKVNWDGNGTFIVKEFAYNDVADAQILAGELPGSGNVDVTQIDVTANGGATTVEVNNTLQLSADVSPGNVTNPDVTWSVNNGTGTASIDANGLLTGLTTGTITAVATADDGSGITGSIEITVVDVQSIGEFANINIDIYPNPFENTIQINTDEPVVLSIYNTNGQMVFTANNANGIIDLSVLNSGVYIAKMSTTNGTSAKRIIKK